MHGVKVFDEGIVVREVTAFSLAFIFKWLGSKRTNQNIAFCLFSFSQGLLFCGRASQAQIEA